MLLLSISLILFVVSSSSAEEVDVNCDEKGVEYYETLGCIPISRSKDGCPAEYSCENLQNYRDKCYYRGKVYDDGQNLTSQEPNCMKRCTCRIYRHDDIVEPLVVCSQIGCREDKRLPLTADQEKDGCYHTYEPGNCCPTGIKCPEDKIATCEWNGVVFKEGKTIEQNDSCKHCVCMKGFNGKLEGPFCQTSACPLSLQVNRQAGIQRYCAPVYLKEGSENKNNLLCCPDAIMCRDGTEDIQPADPTLILDGAKGKCIYGNITLKLGESFRRVLETFMGIFKYNVECKCLIPPMLTCREI